MGEKVDVCVPTGNFGNILAAYYARCMGVPLSLIHILLHMEKVARPDDAADAIAIALCHARSSTSLLHQKGYLG